MTEEIRARPAPSTPLPDTEQKVVEAARAWRVAVFVDSYGDSDIEHFADALVDAVDALENAEGER